MSSVRMIAQQAGVSITTVSRALNNDPAVNRRTRERVLEVANNCGYVATMGRRITTNIGFAYTGGQTLSTVFDTSVLEGVAKGVDEQRFDVVLLNLQRDKEREETYTQFFMRKGVRGVILRTTAESREVCRAIAAEGFPHVVISERFDSGEVNFIDCDSKTSSVRAVEYLITLGHRRIAFARNVVPDCDHLDRTEGYREALTRASLPFDGNLIFEHPANLAGGATVLEMVMNMTPRATAIYFADPLLAVGAVNRAHELGARIPADLSVIGFDDGCLRQSVYPKLTAVCQDASALGFEAALRLTRVLADATAEPFQKTVPSFFEVNQSTGPPPKLHAEPTAAAPGTGQVTPGQPRVAGLAASVIAESRSEPQKDEVSQNESHTP
ncbi:MAG: LacI family transcriptional regulator [bacterium]|nr:LacI family transcriptional regulator [bacterium]